MKETGYSEVLKPTKIFLPPKVTQQPKDAIRTYSHTKRVGNYLLGKTLGEGSFAKVKEALHMPTGEKVAIKIVDKNRAQGDPYVRKNLRREGKILQMVRHPHVVGLLEIMETENCYYLITELCRGGDFMDYVCLKKKLEEQECKKYVRQIVSAVQFLHRLGIIHRDLKIENLLLDSNKNIKIIDFGLSNCIKVATVSRGNAVKEFCVTQCGSPAYAAPELLSHQKYGPQVDVWSIGVNMFAMLTGSLPFTVEPFNINALYKKIIRREINPMSVTPSQECKDLLNKLLLPDPSLRITIDHAMKHAWLAGQEINEIQYSTNTLKHSELDNNILKHMCHNLGFKMNDTIRYCTGHIASPANATYQLFLKKLERYNAEMRVQGRVPAVESSLTRPTKISLVFGDLPVKHTILPIGAKLLRRRSDFSEKDISGNDDADADTHVEAEHKSKKVSLLAVPAKEISNPSGGSNDKSSKVQRLLKANPPWLRKGSYKEKNNISGEVVKLNPPNKGGGSPYINGKNVFNREKHRSLTRKPLKPWNSVPEKSSKQSVNIIRSVDTKSKTSKRTVSIYYPCVQIKDKTEVNVNHVQKVSTPSEINIPEIPTSRQSTDIKITTRNSIDNNDTSHSKSCLSNKEQQTSNSINGSAILPAISPSITQNT